MSGQILWGKFALFTGAIMAAGWGIMRLTTPTEEQFYNSLSPELKRKVDAVRLQRQSMSPLQEKLNTAGEQDQVVWAEQLGSTKPAGGGRRV